MIEQQNAVPVAGRAAGADARAFRPDVEGLRAVAILLVIGYHAFARRVSGGYVGVDVFFVISGFLITRQLVGELGRSGRLSLSGFYARRARRILPAATLVTIVTLVASRLILSPLETRSVTSDALSAAVFGINYRVAALGNNYLTASGPISPLQHYWSLSIEEQFYVIWPALLIAASLLWERKRPMRGVAVVLGALAAGSFVLSVVMTGSSPVWAYYALWTRGWELAAGALVAVGLPLLRRLPAAACLTIGWAGLAAISYSAWAFDTATPFPGTLALVPVLGAAAVIVAGSGAGRSAAAVERLLALRPFQAVGRLSYSLYLWHYPVLILGAVALGHRLLPVDTWLLLALATTAAYLSYRFVERPIRGINVFVRHPRRGLAIGSGFAATAVAVALIVTASLPSLEGPGSPGKLTSATTELTLAELHADLAAGLTMRAVPRNLTPSLSSASSDVPVLYKDGCHVMYAGVTSPPCVFGATDSTKIVVLFGDSHGAQWFPALRTIAIHEGWRLVSLTKSGCPAAYVSVTRRPGSIAYPQCNTWRDYALRRIASLHPAVVITSWSLALSQFATAIPGTPTGYGGMWLNGVAKTLKSLRHSAGRVVLLTDTPHFPRDVPICLSENLVDQRPCVQDRANVLVKPWLAHLERQLAVRLGVGIVDPTPWVCTADGCPVIVGNILMYRDADHLVPQFVRFVAPVLQRALTAVLATG